MKALIKLLEKDITFKVKGLFFNWYHRHNLRIMYKTIGHDNIRRNASSEVNKSLPCNGQHISGSHNEKPET